MTIAKAYLLSCCVNLAVITPKTKADDPVFQTPVIESKGRGVLDTPHARGMMTECDCYGYRRSPGPQLLAEMRLCPRHE
jgi:hypothetical protein